MARAVNTAVLRWTVEEQEAWRRQFAAIGGGAEDMFDKMSRSSRPANNNLKALNRTSGELRDGFEDLAGRAGPLGNILRGLGPAGLVAAAGLGAVVAAGGLFLRWLEQARETIGFAGDLEAVALSAGVAERAILDVRTMLALAGGTAASADTALEEFNKRLGEFRSFGTGELRDAVEQLGMADELRDGRLPVEAALDRVLDALEEIEDPSRRLSLADKLGLRDASPLLQRSAEDIERIRDATSEINAGLSQATLTRLAEQQSELNALELRRERNEQIRAMIVSPVEMARQRALTELDDRRTAAAITRIPMEERSVDLLEIQLAAYEQEVERLEDINNSEDVRLGRIQGRIREEQRYRDLLREVSAELERQRADEQMARDLRLLFIDGGFIEGPMDGSGVVQPPAVPSGDESEASLEQQNQAAARLAAAMDRARTPAERLRHRIQEMREDYAALNDEQRNNLGITEDWIDRMVLAERVALGLADATALLIRAEREKVWLSEDMAALQEEWNRLAEASRTAEERAEDRIKEINEALRARLSLLGDLAPGEAGYADVMAERASAEAIAAEAIKQVNAGLAERAEAFAAGSVEAERANEIERLKIELLGEVADPERALIERRRLLNQLVASGTISQARATRELALYRTELVAMEAELAGFTGLGKLIADSEDLAGALDTLAVRSMSDLSSSLSQIILDFDNAGEAAGRFFDRIIEGLLEMALQQYVIGPLAQGLFGFLGGFVPGASGSGASVGFDAGFASAFASPAASGAAPRAAASASQAIRRAAPPPSGQAINTVTVRGAPEGSEARSVARPGRDGGLDIEVFLERQIERSAAPGGALNRVLKQRGLPAARTPRG